MAYMQDRQYSDALHRMPTFSLDEPLSIQTYGSIVPNVPIEETLSALTSG